MSAMTQETQPPPEAPTASKAPPGLDTNSILSHCFSCKIYLICLDLKKGRGNWKTYFFKQQRSGNARICRQFLKVYRQLVF